VETDESLAMANWELTKAGSYFGDTSSFTTSSHLLIVLAIEGLEAKVVF
jgi:hypothetical protein